jgi:hypothetical protein
VIIIVVVVVGLLIGAVAFVLVRNSKARVSASNDQLNTTTPTVVLPGSTSKTDVSFL